MLRYFKIFLHVHVFCKVILIKDINKWLPKKKLPRYLKKKPQTFKIQMHVHP